MDAQPVKRSFLKRWLPYEKYTLQTPLSSAEVIARLHAARDRDQRVSIPGLHTLAQHVYHGDILGNTFELRRVIDYRNSLLPVVRGTITGTEHGTEIQIVMRPSGFVLGFMVFWFGALFVIFLLLILAEIAGLINDRTFSGTVFVPLGMMVFGALLCNFGFRDESEGARIFFDKLLTASEPKA